jgi:hypothetical protein
MAQASERFRKITDYGVIPSPSGADALVLHAEEGRDCLVVLIVAESMKLELTGGSFGLAANEALRRVTRRATGPVAEQ